MITVNYVEVGSGTARAIEIDSGTSLGDLMRSQSVSKHSSVTVNNRNESRDYVLQPNDRVLLSPNVEAG